MILNDVSPVYFPPSQALAQSAEEFECGICFLGFGTNYRPDCKQNYEVLSVSLVLFHQQPSGRTLTSLQIKNHYSC